MTLHGGLFQGTCPDMCPEKERYMRVIQKRLSPYECREDGRMAPELTVKEYSRSAADQVYLSGFPLSMSGLSFRIGLLWLSGLFNCINVLQA